MKKKVVSIYPPNSRATLLGKQVTTMPGFKPALAVPKEQDIQHFTIAEWVDLSRGLLNGATAGAMQAHAASCETCRELTDYCAKLARVCSGIAGGEAPGEAVRRAYTIFSDAKRA